MKWIAALIVICVPLAGLADDAMRAPSTRAEADASKTAKNSYVGPPLYCRDSDGNRREIGAVICVTASCTTWMARCEQSLNNSTWRKVSDGCPAVSLQPEVSPGDLLRRLKGLDPRLHAGAVDAHVTLPKA